jgi:UDP-N-acetylmuramate: L-alanyl-gamma-D-glutamyl-meso-diaminopimelate ligase
LNASAGRRLRDPLGVAIVVLLGLDVGPDARVVGALAHDHVNVFPTIESYLAPFHHLFDLVPRDGLIVAATSGDLSVRFLAEAKRDVVTFGLTRGDWRAENIEYGAVSQFTLTERGREIARVKTTQLGAHNIENMVGIGSFVLTRGLASVEQYAAAMASFRGVMRRLDRKSDHTSVQIFEGFGSSCDKAKSAIAAMKKHFAQRRLLTPARRVRASHVFVAQSQQA